jgi:hypothetical protein
VPALVGGASGSWWGWSVSAGGSTFPRKRFCGLIEQACWCLRRARAGWFQEAWLRRSGGGERADSVQRGDSNPAPSVPERSGAVPNAVVIGVGVHQHPPASTREGSRKGSRTRAPRPPLSRILRPAVKRFAAVRDHPVDLAVDTGPTRAESPVRCSMRRRRPPRDPRPGARTAGSAPPPPRPRSPAPPELAPPVG